MWRRTGGRVVARDGVLGHPSTTAYPGPRGDTPPGERLQRGRDGWVVQAGEANVEQARVVVGAALGVEMRWGPHQQVLGVQGHQWVWRVVVVVVVVWVVQVGGGRGAGHGVGQAAALGARGAAAKVGGTRRALGVITLARTLHTQEPGYPL